MKKKIFIIVLKAIGAIVALLLGYLGVAACTSSAESQTSSSGKNDDTMDASYEEVK